MVTSGLIRQVDNQIDKRLLCYEVTQKELAQNVVDKYNRSVSYKLAKLVPDNNVRITQEQLKRNQEFINLCSFYGLTFDEGIVCLRECPKIKNERTQGTFVFWKEEVETLPQRKKVVFGVEIG